MAKEKISYDAAVSEIEEILGQLRVRAASKVQRARALFDKHVDLDRIEGALGLGRIS